MVAPTIIAQLEKVQTPPREQNLHDCIDLRLSSKMNVNVKWTILEPGDSYWVRRLSS